MRLGLLIYLAGVVLGVSLSDAAPAGRLALALVWPLGVVAFLVTITALLAASFIFFPVVGVVTAGAAVLWWVFG
jgi:hypothetical protein